MNSARTAVKRLKALAKRLYWTQPVTAGQAAGAAEVIERQQRELTDAAYMQVALVSLLGPVALQVWQGWQKQGVKRVHHSWGVEARQMTGEQRAQLLLDFENAPRTLVSSVDSMMAKEVAP